MLDFLWKSNLRILCLQIIGAGICVTLGIDTRQWQTVFGVAALVAAMVYIKAYFFMFSGYPEDTLTSTVAGAGSYGLYVVLHRPSVLAFLVLFVSVTALCVHLGRAIGEKLGGRIGKTKEPLVIAALVLMPFGIGAIIGGVILWHRSRRPRHVPA